MIETVICIIQVLESWRLGNIQQSPEKAIAENVGRSRSNFKFKVDRPLPLCLRHVKQGEKGTWRTGLGARGGKDQVNVGERRYQHDAKVYLLYRFYNVPTSLKLVHIRYTDVERLKL